MKKLVFAALAVLLYPSVSLAQDAKVDQCEVLMGEVTPVWGGNVHVTFRMRARVCVSPTGAFSTGTVYFYPKRTDPPQPPYSSSISTDVSFGMQRCVYAESPVIETDLAPNEVVTGYCALVVDGQESDQSNNVGSTRWGLLPDLYIASFWHEIKGVQVNYHIRICNQGFGTANNFRVGLYYSRPAKPVPGQYGDIFEPVEKLEGARCKWWWDGICDYWEIPCKDIEIVRNPMPNGEYNSWAKVDSGEFVEEMNEDNNVAGPIPFTLANPDLVIEEFSAKASKTQPYTVQYHVKVCNRGAGIAKVFWVDVYFHRDPDDPPGPKQPGEWHRRVDNLRVNECRDFTVVWDDSYDLKPRVGKFNSYAQVDSDLFVPDPKRMDNMEGPITVVIPGTDMPPGCPDQDGDGWGYGLDCSSSMLDCNDHDPNIHPGREEICGNGLDDNCNQTVDDGCPGVDCEDHDGDGWPSGPDCVRKDCDDSDPSRFPGAEEICGDHIDNDCDGYADDCCPGTDYCDSDGDGACVDDGCPGPRDPDCVENCHGDIECIRQCPLPPCVDQCNGDVECIKNCAVYDPECVAQCNGDLACIQGCPPAEDADDNNPYCTWEGGSETCGDHIDNDCDGLIDEGCPGSYCNDKDGDGYGVGEGCPVPWDCDDNNPLVHPGAADTCGDGLDNDCDGIVDGMCEDACNDSDGDGWKAGLGCLKDKNEREKLRDCDDTDEHRHPFAPEICGNGIDDNCDGTTDDVPCVDPIGAEECEGITDLQAYEQCLEEHGGYDPEHCLPMDTAASAPCHDPDCVYNCWLACGHSKCPSFMGCVEECPIWDPDEVCRDQDGDGFSGGGKNCPDCDDSDDTRHPGALEECDGIDQNCNGVVDDTNAFQELCPDPECAAACGDDDDCRDSCDRVQCVDHDGDGWGVGTDCGTSVDPDDSNPSVYPGAEDTCGDGIDNDGDGEVDEGCAGMCIDHDGDGYGVGPGCTVADCDDSDPAVHPGADEKCGDRDLNCDGIPPAEQCSACSCTTPARRTGIPWTIAGLLLAALAVLRRRIP